MFQTIIKKKTIQDFSMLSNIPLSYNINTILNGQETINNTARCLHQTQGPVGFDGDITKHYLCEIIKLNPLMELIGVTWRPPFLQYDCHLRTCHKPNGAYLPTPDQAQVCNSFDLKAFELPPVCLLLLPKPFSQPDWAPCVQTLSNHSMWDL